MAPNIEQDRENPADVSLYFGKVMHARLKPKQHRFNYRVFSLLIDLDQLTSANMKSRFFSVNQANLMSFHEKDHGKRDGSSLRSYIDQVFANGGMERPHRISLWCNPRVLGYTFNPLSIYYCYNVSGEITALVYQVHNTFGEDHSYIAQVLPPHKSGASIRQSADKIFYVSPFLDMNMRYNFRINAPGKDLRIRILENDAEGPILSATFSGERRAFNTKNLLSGATQCFGLTWKIMAGIHYEAFILWCKRVKFHKRPAPPVKTSYVKHDKFAAGE